MSNNTSDSAGTPVALLVGFGAMIGRMLEVSGGAQVLADRLIGQFGPERAPLALYEYRVTVVHAERVLQELATATPR